MNFSYQEKVWYHIVDETRIFYIVACTQFWDILFTLNFGNLKTSNTEPFCVVVKARKGIFINNHSHTCPGGWNQIWAVEFQILAVNLNGLFVFVDCPLCCLCWHAYMNMCVLYNIYRIKIEVINMQSWLHKNKLVHEIDFCLFFLWKALVAAPFSSIFFNAWIMSYPGFFFRFSSSLTWNPLDSTNNGKPALVLNLFSSFVPLLLLLCSQLRLL